MYICMEDFLEFIICPECNEILNPQFNEFHFALCCKHCQKVIISCGKCGKEILFNIPTRIGSKKDKEILNLSKSDPLRIITEKGMEKALLKDQWQEHCYNHTVGKYGRL